MMRNYLLASLFLFSITTMIYSCRDAGQVKQDIYYTNGRDLYIKHCQNCHGVNGEGLGSLVPALTDTTFLKHNRQKLACFIKNGIKQSMPDFSTLADIDLAQLIVYTTNSFGNKQGMYTFEEVARDLKNCK